MRQVTNKVLKEGFILLLALLFLSGCGGKSRTHLKHYESILTNVYSGKYMEAVNDIKKARADGYYAKKDRVLYYLELGTAYHYAGMYDSSNVALEIADDYMDDLFTKSISNAATSLLLNDNALDYFGEDYEQLYVNVFKALNYIHLNDFDGAFVEVKRAHIKLGAMEYKYEDYADEMNSSKDQKSKVEITKPILYDDVLTRYLSMSLYRAEGNVDDAEIDLRKINELLRNLPSIYNFRQAPFFKSPIMEPVPLQVLAFTGPAPQKYAVELRITTYKNLLQIRSSKGTKDKYWMNLFMPIEQGWHFKFQLPEIATPGTKVANINVYANDELLGQMNKIENMQNVALKTFETHQSIIKFKTITRAVVKGLAAAEAKKEIRKSSDKGWVNLLTDVAVNVAVDATENADLRAWRTMPGYAWSSEFKLLPGTYSIRVEYQDADGMFITKRVYPEVKVGNDKLNFVESFVHY